MKKAFAVLLVFCLLWAEGPALMTEAVAEMSYQWTCSECGETGNYANYCVRCGTVRSADSYLNEGNTDGIRREEVSVNRIDGSSFITAKKNRYLHEPSKALDGDPSTCWQFSAKKGLKDKAWLSLIIEGETVDEIWLRNGYQYANDKGRYLYPDYDRFKEIRVLFEYDDRDNEVMSFTLSDDHGDGWERLVTGQHENVYSVIIYIDSVYKGKKNANTVCLTDVMLVRTLTETPSAYHDGSHCWEAWQVRQPAGSDHTGTRTQTCRICGVVQEESFDPEGTLRKGDQGKAVKELQRLLNAGGYSCGKADGKFGGKTVDAIMKLQQDNGMTPDGVAWPRVIAILKGEDVTPETENIPYEALILTVTQRGETASCRAGDILTVDWTLENPLDMPLKDWTLTYSAMDDQVLMMESGMALEARSRTSGTWSHRIEEAEILWAGERCEGIYSPDFFAQGYDGNDCVAYSNNQDVYLPVSETAEP